MPKIRLLASLFFNKNSAPEVNVTNTLKSSYAATLK